MELGQEAVDEPLRTGGGLGVGGGRGCGGGQVGVAGGGRSGACRCPCGCRAAACAGGLGGGGQPDTRWPATSRACLGQGLVVVEAPESPRQPPGEHEPSVAVGQAGRAKAGARCRRPCSTDAFGCWGVGARGGGELVSGGKEHAGHGGRVQPGLGGHRGELRGVAPAAGQQQPHRDARGALGEAERAGQLGGGDVQAGGVGLKPAVEGLSRQRRQRERRAGRGGQGGHGAPAAASSAVLWRVRSRPASTAACSARRACSAAWSMRTWSSSATLSCSVPVLTAR